MAENTHENIELSAGDATVRMKIPKRVLHFSDGTIEEFTDSETEDLPTEHDSTIAPVSSPRYSLDGAVTPLFLQPPEGWGPWLLLKLRETGQTTLSACDYVGEALASFLGITSPKYQYELEEYQRMVAEKMEQDAKAKGWISTEAETNDIRTEQPLNHIAPTHV